MALSLRSGGWLAAAAACFGSIAMASLVVRVDSAIVLVFAIALGSLGVIVMVLGVEGIIVVAGLGAFGVVPFADPGAELMAGLPLWFLFVCVTIGAMLLAWGMREAAREHAHPPQASLLLIAMVALFVYTLVVMLTSDPTSLPSVAGPFVAFPSVALATFLWLSHEQALDGLSRALPVVAAIAASWALAYIGGAAGVCEPCIQAVSSENQNEGLLGPGSRLYTPGQNAFLALVVVAFAAVLRRPSAPSIGLAALGLTAVALQSSRAQYAAIVAAMAFLLVWRFARVGPRGRLAIAAIVVTAGILVAGSPVGERAASGYVDVQQGTGTFGYRLGLLEDAAENWTTFGQGVSRPMLNLGFDVDLGLSNTLLVIGFVGGTLQISVLALGLIRGLRARTLAGATIAAVLLVALTARPTLPLIEYGHSTGAYAATVGFAAALVLHRRRSQSTDKPGAVSAVSAATTGIPRPLPR